MPGDHQNTQTARKLRRPSLVVVVLAVAIALSTSGTPRFAQGAAADLNLPDDFPIPVGLGKCNPVVISTEVICQWHDVDPHATYVFYLTALSKAGYTLLPGAREARSATFYLAAIGFRKGNRQGAVTIDRTGDLKVQVLFGRTP